MSQDEDLEAIYILLRQYLSGAELDMASMARLGRWLEASPDNKLLLQQLQDDGWLAEEMAKLNQVQTGHLRESVLEQAAAARSATVKRFVLRASMAAAAVVVMVLGATWFFRTFQKKQALPLARTIEHPGQVLSQDTVLPVNRATLRLADGSLLELDKVRKGEMIKQGNYIIIKLDSNWIGYPLQGENGEYATVAAGSNTLFVPPGARWQVRLPDGTNAWVNAGSSLRYPLAYAGAKREVELEGEAYFDVAKRKIPFTVALPNMGGWEVGALGTIFNVRAFAGERSLRATLGEGKIQVIRGSDSVLLQPNQEAQVNIDSSVIRVIPHVNAEDRFAWRSGHFDFENMDLRAAIREVAQWYGADEPRFEQGTATALPGGGSIGRDLTLRTLLKNMSNDSLHFSLENRTIVASR